MSYKLGFECFLYVNTAAAGPTQWSAPVWTECDTIKDAALVIESDEVDVSIRRGKGWKSTVAGLQDLPLELVMVKESGNAIQELLKECSLSRRKFVDVMILDGPNLHASGGQESSGMRAWFSVLRYEEGQALADHVPINVTLKVGWFPAGQEPREAASTQAT